MEMKYGFMIPVGVVLGLVLLLAFIFAKTKRNKYKDGIKVANTELLMEDPYIKRKVITYRVLQVLLLLAIIAGIVMSCGILSQPYRIKMTKEETYSRDIMICLDISTSVDELNAKLVKELQETVRHLSGERVGIVVFNTTPVLLSPLTDDYEYTIEQLGNIEKGLKAMNSTFKSGELDNWLYWNSYLYSGTLVGNTERGSSLIADGLLGAVFNFPQEKEKRTRIVIFSTDNDLAGDAYVTLSEAADICKKKGIVVYGIGTEQMYPNDEREMREAMEKTGGKFFMEEDSATFHKIIEEIEAQSANLVKGKTIIRKAEDPEKWYQYLIAAFVVLVLISVLLRRWNIWWLGRQIIIVVLLCVLFTKVIEPARWTAIGNGMKVKTSSNLDVLFVVDDTLSMMAQDYNGKNIRLDGVKKDCQTIIEELNGAKFGVVSFNNETSVLCPFTNNGDHALNVINSIKTLDDLYAKGSSLNTPRDTMLEILKMAAGEEKKNKLAVFYFSDGEITGDEPLGSYAELANYVSSGAVMGYGTNEGGIMELQSSWEEEPHVLMDYSEWPSTEALSKIDEKNLKQIAKDMNVVYLNRNKGGSFDSVLEELKKDIQISVPEEDSKDNEGTVELENEENLWYWLTLAVVFMLLTEAALLIRRR